VATLEKGFTRKRNLARGKEKKDFTTESQRKNEEKGFDAEKETRGDAEGAVSRNKAKSAVPSNEVDCRVTARCSRF